MKNKLFQRVICLILSVAILGASAVLSVSAATLKVDPTGTEKNPYSASTLDEMKALVGTLSYAEYIDKFGEYAKDGLSEIPVDIFNIVEGSNGEIVSKNEICN